MAINSRPLDDHVRKVRERKMDLMDNFAEESAEIAAKTKRAARETSMEDEYVASLRRAFVDRGCDYIVMDGRAAQSSYIRDSWDWSVERGLIEVEEHERDQWTELRGRLTDKGRKIVSSS